MTYRLLLVACAAVALSLSAGCKGDPNTPEYWEKKLDGSKRPAERVKVLEELRASGKANAALLPMLQKRLKSESSAEVRSELVRALASVNDPSLVTVLTDSIDWSAADSTANGPNRQIAAALGRIGDPSATQTLLKLLKSKDSYVRIEAINALGALKAKDAVDPLLAIVSDNSTEPYLSKKAIQALGNINDPRAVPTLIRMMFKERRNVSFYPESSYALIQIGTQAQEALLPVVRGEDKALTAWARENDIVEPAIYAKAAQLVGDFSDARATPALLARLSYTNPREDYQYFVRMKAADALGRLRAREAVKPLSGMVTIDEPTVRDEFSRALARIGGRDAIPALTRAASAGSWDARESAISGLALVGDEREKPVFEKLTTEAQTVTTEECKQIPDEPSCEKPGELVKKRQAIIADNQKRLDAAAECKADAECWAKKLDDPSALVKERAAYEVGRSGKAELIDELLKRLNENDLRARLAMIQAADWLLTDDKAAATKAKPRLAALEEQIAKESTQTQFVKVNEDLKRLALKISR